MPPNLLPSSGDTEEPEGSDASTSFASRAAQADAFEKERQEALANPGPSWRDWFLYQGAKWWIGLGFFIIDVWILLTWIAPLNVLLLVPVLGAALYLEFLAYRFLWYRWDPEKTRDPIPFRPTWLRPRQVGLWTPEGDAAKRGEGPVPAAPRREDFL